MLLKYIQSKNLDIVWSKATSKDHFVHQSVRPSNTELAKRQYLLGVVFFYNFNIKHAKNLRKVKEQYSIAFSLCCGRVPGRPGGQCGAKGCQAGRHHDL